MSSNLNCPSCGGVIKLASSVTVFVTCSYCRSTLIHDRDWKLVGKVADLPPEVTHLQVGTTGTYEGEKFELIGRRRLRWPDGYWSEWCARFPKERIGWLAEAQGTLAMGFEIDAPVHMMKNVGLRPGAEVVLGTHGKFTIDDNKRALVVGTEGELPYIVDPKLGVLTLDGSDRQGKFCSLEYDQAAEKWTAFVGRYMDFADFNFQYLRQLDDW